MLNFKAGGSSNPRLKTVLSSGSEHIPVFAPGASEVVKVFNGTSINAETTIWTPTAGKKFRVVGYHLVSSVAGNILLRDNTAGTIIIVVPSAAGGAGVPVELGQGIVSAAANNVLTAIGPASSTLNGIVWGVEE